MFTLTLHMNKEQRQLNCSFDYSMKDSKESLIKKAWLKSKLHDIPLRGTRNKSVFHLDCIFIQSDIVVNSSSIETYKDIFPCNTLIKTNVYT